MIYRPELIPTASRKRARAAVYARRLQGGSCSTALEAACCKLSVTVLSQDAGELERLAHCPRPEARRQETPLEFIARMGKAGHMHICAPWGGQ